MNRNSTRLLTFLEIKTDSIDIVGDAFGYDNILASLWQLPGFQLKNPSQECINQLLQKAGLSSK